MGAFRGQAGAGGGGQDLRTGAGRQGATRRVRARGRVPARPAERRGRGSGCRTARVGRPGTRRVTGPDLGSEPMRLAVIPGDGIGPEVVAEALKVLGEVAPDIESTPYDLGAARWQRTGELL